jgi:hypothetical protein
MTISKAGRPITTLEEWGEHAGPKSDIHWKAGRSAVESARSWLSCETGAMPSDIMALMASHAQFGAVLNWSAEPEARLMFDNLREEPRNTDLPVKARDAFGDYLIALEAKPDEPFGQSVAKTLDAAKLRLAENASSGGVKRINGLLAALFGSSLDLEPELGGLPYQLLTATAGAVAEALRQRVGRVVLLVQEFRTDFTVDSMHRDNSAALDAFITRLSLGKVQHVATGELVGPFTLQGAVLFRACPDIYVGKVVHEQRRSAAKIAMFLSHGFESE